MLRSQVDVCRGLIEAGYVCEKIWNRATEADHRVQGDWEGWLVFAGFTATQYVFVDETATVSVHYHALSNR